MSGGLDELELAALDIVKEEKKARYLNEHMREELAKDMIKKNKIGDSKWLCAKIDKMQDILRTDRKKAKKHGYEPFSMLDPQTSKYINERYGKEYFEVLKRLKDAEKVFPKWAVQFCDAVHRIGLENTKAHPDDVHKFVVANPAWKAAKQGRREFKYWKKQHSLDQHAES